MPPLHHALSTAENTLRQQDLYHWCLDQQQQQQQVSDMDATNSTKAMTINMLQCLADAVLNHGAAHDESLYSASLYAKILSNREFLHSVALLLCAALVWFMQAGFCMLCAGVVRRKNLINTLMKNLLDAGGAALAYYVVGYALAFGGDDDDYEAVYGSFSYNTTASISIQQSTSSTRTTTFMGRTNFCLVGLDPSNYILWLFQCSFGAAATTIIAGTLAERCQMTAYFAYAIVLAGWVYPIIAHAVWSRHGWLSAYNDNHENDYYHYPFDNDEDMVNSTTISDVSSSSSSSFAFDAPLFGVGMVDFAGAGVVHVTGGVTALIATIILGPRRGRFHDETGRLLTKARDFPGHDMSLQMLGTIILWFGWYGFNLGSALMGDRDRGYTLVGLTAVNTTLSGGAAGLTSLLYHYYYLDRTTGEPYFELKYLMLGSLCGLAAITAGCGVMEPWAALITGVVAGFLYTFSSRALLRFRIDDAVDAIPVHMVSGCWGLVSVGLFASPRYLEEAYHHARHPGWFYTLTKTGGGSDATLLAAQLCGILFIYGWVLINMLPFFVWLDWKGWFRSEAMEEVVGLDRSFHGGLALLAREEVVRAEHIDAYQKRKKEGGLRKRRSRLRGNFDTESMRIDDLMEMDRRVNGAGVDVSSLCDEEITELQAISRNAQ